MGRPSLLNAPSAIDPSKTVSQAIIEARGVGQSIDGAAEAVGVGRSVVYKWQRRGQMARDAMARGEEVESDDLPYVEFVDGLQRSFHQGVLARIARIAKAAQDGTTTRTVVKEALNDQGILVVIERTTTTTRAPQWTADAWFLERVLSSEFGKKMELTGADGAPLVPEADRAAGLSDALRAYQLGLEDKAKVDVPA